ncbi:hypothetical protein CBR_g837 [Chara braunii]|uniref:Uncharacterized protein n=1 Tax=Chara braunii TaxID=69332 RepID=A0A388KCE5_CHABU|nr:hypothetical protein CBR_g837 [Chara braunii]|eukprot:GBG67709.1 hypothetical protein CBR_g837 [Chara braunii]
MLERECSSSESLVDRLLRENEELRRKVNATRDPLENGMSVLMKEMQELWAGREKDKELLVGLKTEVGLLRKEKEQSVEETQTWMNEALRPGNKRGCISMTTPEIDNSIHSMKLKDMEQCTLRGVEVLKQRKTAEERKRMEAESEKLVAEAEVAKLREQIDKLTAEVVAAPTGGMNLKSRSEAATEAGGSEEDWKKR